jgi:hypothetical protein
MGKFIKGIYEDDGFMLGYILNGDTNKIIGNINLRISSTYSEKDNLRLSGKYYISTHNYDKKSKELVHIFLDFSSLI